MILDSETVRELLHSLFHIKCGTYIEQNRLFSHLIVVK